MAKVNYHTTLDCPLCFKKFTSPRVLPCFHTFCEKCLHGHIDSQVQGVSKFACPQCARETIPSDSNLVVEKWSSTFPLNTLVCSLIELSLEKDNSDFKCEPCKAGGENKTAEFWCTVCHEKLCSSCNGLHTRNKLLRNHTIVSIDDMEQHKQCNINFDLECSRHGDKVKLFCVDHRELCCAVCVATDHRQCNDVPSIDDITRDQSQWSSSEYPSIIQDIKKLKTAIEKIMTAKKSNTRQIVSERDQILHDMNTRIDKIINHLNKLRNAFREEADQLCNETQNSILKEEIILQSFMTSIENTKKILEIVETTGTPQQKFTIFENNRRQIVSHYDKLKSELKNNIEVHFSMKSNKLLDDVEKSVTSLGSMYATSKLSTASRDGLQITNKIIKNLNSYTKISTEVCAAQVEKIEDFRTLPVTFVKAVKRDKRDNSRWFTGGTFLGDGRLVMCDYHYMRLVELDEEYNVAKEYKIRGHPSDVAAGKKDNELFIAVNQDYIYKGILNTDLTIVRRIKSPQTTWGITVWSDHIIVGTSDAVVILTQDGSTVRSIPKSGYNSYVAVSLTQRTIYHKDKNDVVCRTWEGQEVFRYQHQQLKGPSGIFIDKYNNVYVCGVHSHNVHQISSDGQRSRIVLDKLHNISQPWSIMSHPGRNQLIVTSYDEDTVCDIYKFIL